ncbi:MAG TPA: MGMT family protein [Acidimicrobiia bacterium]|nr:MGMT family protein [Acidimicrobiia bacterium]
MAFDIESPLGTIMVKTRDGVVTEIVMPGWIGAYDGEDEETSYVDQKRIRTAFENYFYGSTPKAVAAAWKELVSTTQESVDTLNGKDSFRSNIYNALTNEIPSGQTVTYGELAELAGNPKAARAVGTAMRRNPLPIIVPCHRVLRGGGGLGGYMGNGDEGLHMKKWLLAHEGAR